MEHAILTDRAVLQARELYADGEWSVRELADQFGVHPLEMEKALKGDSWGHLPFFVKIVCMYCKKTLGVKGGFKIPGDETSGICMPCKEIHHPAKESVDAQQH